MSWHDQMTHTWCDKETGSTQQYELTVHAPHQSLPPMLLTDTSLGGYFLEESSFCLFRGRKQDF